MFYDANKKPYYIEHKEGSFDIDALKEQGSLTVKEAAEKKEKENESTKGFIERLLKAGAIIGAVTVIGKALIGVIGSRKKAA